jgi:hypothetical protein
MIYNPIFPPDPFEPIGRYIVVVVICEILAVTVGTVVLKKLLRDIDITWPDAALTVGVTAFVSFMASLLIWFFAGLL